MNKKILLVLVAVLTLVFVFTGCESYDFGPVAGDDYSKELVIGNGGVAVQQGNYLYFVNGSAGIAADNTFGKVVKGAIMRYKVDSNGALVGEPVTIVPKAAYGTSTVSGITISSSDTQSIKVDISIVFIPFGRLISLNALQSINAPLPIFLTVAGRTIFSKYDAIENAPLLISITV